MTEYEFETQVKFLYRDLRDDFTDIVNWTILRAVKENYILGKGWRICFCNVPHKLLAFIHALNIETVPYYGRENNTLFKITEEQLKLFKQMEKQIEIMKEFEDG